MRTWTIAATLALLSVACTSPPASKEHLSSTTQKEEGGDDDSSSSGDDDTGSASSGDDDSSNNTTSGDDDTANSSNGDDDTATNASGDDDTANSSSSGDDDTAANNNGDDDTANSSSSSGGDDTADNNSSSSSGGDDTAANGASSSGGAGDDDDSNGDKANASSSSSSGGPDDSTVLGTTISPETKQQAASVMANLPSAMQNEKVQNAIETAIQTAKDLNPSTDFKNMHFAGVYIQTEASAGPFSGAIGVGTDGNAYGSLGMSKGGAGVDATVYAVFANPGKEMKDVVGGPSWTAGGYYGLGGGVFNNSSGAAIGIGAGVGFGVGASNAWVAPKTPYVQPEGFINDQGDWVPGKPQPWDRPYVMQATPSREIPTD